MPASFDPYTQWLAITDAQRPPHHYQLIGLPPLCDDPQAISAAADAALLRLRSIDPGANAQAWQLVLDELSIARMTLTNPLRKLQYDAQLRTRLADAASAIPQSVSTAPQVARASPPAPRQSTAKSQPPITAPPSATLSHDPNLFPPGAAPAVSMPMPVRPAAPPVATPPVAAPGVQSVAMPPIQVGPQLTAAPAALPEVAQPVVTPVAKPVVAHFPQASLAMPPFGSTPRPVQSKAELARSFETVPMPLLAQRPTAPAPEAASKEAASIGAASIGAASTGAEPFGSPGVQPREIVVVAQPAPRTVGPPNSIAEPAVTAPTAASASPPAEQGDEPAFMATGMTPGRRPADSFAVPDYLSRQSHKSHTGAIIGGTAAVVLVVVGIILGTARKRPPEAEPTRVARASIPAADRDDATAIQRPAMDVTPRENQPGEPAKPAADTISTVDANRSQPVKNDKPQPAPVDDGPATLVMPDEPESASDPNPADTKPTQATPAAEPAPPPADPKPEVDPEKAASFARSMKVARASLGTRNLAKAKQQVEAAIAAASTQPQHDQAERLRLLTGYVDEFWTNVGKALKDLQPTDEIKIGSTTAAVVESDATSITVHVAGKNLSYKLADMPVGLVIALADRWFDAKNPTTKVFYGAFHAADAKGDAKEAKRLWEEANLAGAPTADLLPMLEEGAQSLVAEQGPVPDEKQLTEAEESFKAAYQQELRTAKSPQRKLEMAKKFVDVAMTTEDPAERYVLFREGYKIASEGGNPPGILRAVDEMAKWYQVDALDLKSTALAKAGAATTNSLVAKAVARSALDLIDQAVSDKRLEHAGKLSQAALVAAKKSKDAALVKQATERDQQVRELNSEK